MGFRQAPGTVRCAQRNWREMWNLRMRDWSVVRFSPRRAAAPSGPPTWPLASSSAFRILARSAFCDHPTIDRAGNDGNRLRR